MLPAAGARVFPACPHERVLKTINLVVPGSSLERKHEPTPSYLRSDPRMVRTTRKPVSQAKLCLGDGGMARKTGADALSIDAQKVSNSTMIIKDRAIRQTRLTVRMAQTKRPCA